MKLLLRILFIPVTGFFLYQVISVFERFSVNAVSHYGETGGSNFPFLIFPIFLLGWILLQLLLEVLAYANKDRDFSYWLKHLRYAPIVAYILSIFIVPISDQIAIAQSKREIRNYIFADSKSVEEPDFRLHNNYRHWCGNGAIAHENYLYFDTASEGINSENPFVRARSLLMSSEVSNFFNGGDRRFDDFLKKSCRDRDPIVKEVAESYLKGSESNCEKYLSRK